MQNSQSVETLLDERGRTHGDFAVHAWATQSIKSVMQSSPNWERLTLAQREALEMIAHKIGRILAGDPNHADHYVDVSGYATLIVRELERQAP